jgi:TPR repeat protein
MMKLRFVVFVALFVQAVTVASMEQEETFTDLTPGIGMLDPANLAVMLSRGDVRAMNNLGLLWSKGYDGKQSHEEALRWWREAANRGYTVSMNNVGLAYAKGQGVEPDMEQALEWWLQSAFLGNAWAMNSVGDCYETGSGVGRNYTMAMTWYQSAAENGDVLGHYNVAALYEAGKGVDRDYDQALTWYRKAAGMGDAGSMRSIAHIYREGLGVKVDMVEAYAWHRIAERRFKPHEASEAELNLKEAARIAAALSSSQLDLAAARIERLEVVTSPPEPEEPLDTGEQRI